METFRRCLIACAVILGAFGAAPAADEPSPDTLRLSLRECLDRAMVGNLDIQEAQLERDRAVIDQFEANRAFWLPVFEARSYLSVVKDARGYITDHRLTTSWDNFGPYFEFHLQAAQPISTLGRVNALKRAARSGIAAREAGVEVRRASVAAEVYRLYYGVLVARELLEILDDVSEKIAQARTRVREMLEEDSDRVTTTDLMRIDVYTYELERKHIEANKSVELALGALRRALGIPYDSHFDVVTDRLRPIPETLPSLDSLRAYAFRNRPELAQINAAIEARRQQLIAARAERYPTPFVGVEVGLRAAPGRELLTENPFVGDAYNGRSVKAALGLQYTLENRSRKAGIQRAEVEYREMLRKREWAEAGIALEVQKAYLEADEARRNSELGRRSLRAGSSLMIQTLERYDMGVASTRDLLEAYGAYAKSQGDYYQTLYSHYLALGEVYRTIGRPLSEITNGTNGLGHSELEGEGEGEDAQFEEPVEPENTGENGEPYELQPEE